MNSRVALAACVVVLQLACKSAGQPPPQSFFGKWLMLDEPGKRRFGIPDMWDGVQAEGGCYTADSVVVDSINQSRLEVGSATSDASFGVQLLDRIGLSATRKQAQSWTLVASGSRIATAHGLRPNLGPGCLTKKDGLPQYPVIASMIGFDSMAFGGKAASGTRIDVTKLDLGKVLKLTGGTHEVRDSLTHFQFVEGAWVGYQLWSLKAKGAANCEWKASFNATETCATGGDGFPFAVTVRPAVDGRFILETRNNSIPNASVEIDTAGMRAFATIGVSPTITGVRGEWYSIGVVKSISPSEVRVRLVKRDYDVRHYMSEADRKALRKAGRR